MKITSIKKPNIGQKIQNYFDNSILSVDCGKMFASV